METEVECARRLRERARVEGAKMWEAEDELVKYEGLDMPIMVSRFV